MILGLLLLSVVVHSCIVEDHHERNPFYKHVCYREVSAAITRLHPMTQTLNETCLHRLPFNSNILIIGDSVDYQLWLTMTFVHARGVLPAVLKPIQKSHHTLTMIKIPGTNNQIFFCRDDYLAMLSEKETIASMSMTDRLAKGRMEIQQRDGSSTKSACSLDAQGKFQSQKIHHLVVGGSRHFFKDATNAVTRRAAMTQYMGSVIRVRRKLIQTINVATNRPHLVLVSICPTDLVGDEVRKIVNEKIKQLAVNDNYKDHFQTSVLDLSNYTETLLQNNFAMKSGGIGEDKRHMYTQVEVPSVKEYQTSFSSSASINRTRLTKVFEASLSPDSKAKDVALLMIDATHFCPAAINKFGNMLTDIIVDHNKRYGSARENG
jgi:hypothetical protein